MKLSDLSKANVPGVGKVDMFNPVALLQVVTGVAVGAMALGIGTRLARDVDRRLPGNQSPENPLATVDTKTMRTKL